MAGLRPQNTLVNLATITTSYQWTLIPLPNLPAWPSVISNLAFAPGTIAYQVIVTLAELQTKTRPSCRGASPSSVPTR